MKRVTLGLLVPAVCLLFAACTTTTGPSAELSCEQRFDRALERGVAYTEALGDYTQCLIDRGDTVNTNVPRRHAVSEIIIY